MLLVLGTDARPVLWDGAAKAASQVRPNVELWLWGTWHPKLPESDAKFVAFFPENDLFFTHFHDVYPSKCGEKW